MLWSLRVHVATPCGYQVLVYSLVAGPTNTESPPEDGKLKSETIVKDNRRYYLDLKENQRGRFLRVMMAAACFFFLILLLLLHLFYSSWTDWESGH